MVVTVRDKGSGIPADFLPKIFDPFVQSDETLDRSEGGLGVGLTLVKSLWNCTVAASKRSARGEVVVVRFC